MQKTVVILSGIYILSQQGIKSAKTYVQKIFKYLSKFHHLKTSTLVSLTFDLLLHYSNYVLKTQDNRKSTGLFPKAEK